MIRLLINFHLLKITALFLAISFNLTSFKKSFPLKVLFQECKFKKYIYCACIICFLPSHLSVGFSQLAVCVAFSRVTMQGA